MITIKIEAELTADVNNYLLGCGEVRQYSSEEVGIRLGTLGLTKKRSKAGSLLLLDRETSRRIHQLAQSYGIDKSVAGCADCEASRSSAR